MRERLFLIIFCFLFALSAVTAESYYIDLLTLKDGTTVSGVIVDQVSGVSVKLETTKQEVLFFEQSEIERIEKQEVDNRMFDISYIDVVCLADGVIFKGMIVEQIPGESIVLITENGVDLNFNNDEIFKIVKQKSFQELKEKTSEIEDQALKIELQIEIALKSLKSKEKESKENGGGEISDLQDEIDMLKDEIDELEEDQKCIDNELLKDHLEMQKEELELLKQKIEHLMDEMLEKIEEHEQFKPSQETESDAKTSKIIELPTINKVEIVPVDPVEYHFLALSSIKDKVDTVKEPGEKEADSAIEEKTLQNLGNEVKSFLDELVDRAIIIQSDEEIEAKAAELATREDLSELLKTKKWRKMRYRNRVVEMVDNLSLEDRAFLYSTYKRRDQLVGIGINAIPYLYIGSWAQGDWIGALSGYLSFILSYIGSDSIMSIIMFGNEETRIVQDDSGFFYEESVLYTSDWVILCIAVAVPYVYGFLQPLLYVHLWNKKLARTLKVDPASVKKEKSSEVSLRMPMMGIEKTKQNGLRFRLNLVSLSY